MLLKNVRAIVIQAFLSKVWMHKRLSDSTPKLSAIFTTAFPVMLFVNDVVVLSDVYLQTSFLKDIFSSVLLSIASIMFVILAVRNDDFLLKREKAYFELLHKEKAKYFLIFIFIDIFVYLLTIYVLFAANDTLKSSGKHIFIN